MDLPNIIIQCLQAALIPETAKAATAQIQLLRNEKQYIRALFIILVNGAPQRLLLSTLTELKVFVFHKNLQANQVQLVKQVFLNILKKYANEKTHKIFRNIVKNFTQNYCQAWLQMQEYENELDSDNSTIEWLVSALTGVCQANRYAQMCNKKDSLHFFDSFFEILIKRTQNCDSYLLHYIIKFMCRYVMACHPKQAHKRVEQMLKFMKIGNVIWQKDRVSHSQDKQTSQQMSKCRKWLLKLTCEWIYKQRQYSKNVEQNYNFDIWKHQQVDNFIQKLLLKLQQQNPYQKQYCYVRILLFSIKTLNRFIPLGTHRAIVPQAQKLLYVSIPKLLFKLKQIILCNGTVLNALDSQVDKDQIQLKKYLLILWRQLSGVNISQYNYSLPKLQQKKINTGLVPRQQLRKIKYKLSSFQLHWKFLFQKLSDTQSFFSTFAYQKDLNDPSIWDLNQHGWTIVLFDLVKATCVQLQQSEYQQIKKTMPILLLSYVLPKLAVNEPLLQSQILATLSTFWKQFQSMTIPSNMVQQFDKLFSQDIDEDVKDVILRTLPSLARNPQINHLLRKKMDRITTLYIETLCEENGDTQLAESFKKILTFFGYCLSDPTLYFNKLVQDFFNQKWMKINYMGYIYCIEIALCLCRKKQQFAKIKKPFIWLAKYTLNFRQMDNYNNQRDTFIQTDILVMISKYINKVDELSNELILLFGAYCTSISGFHQDVFNLMGNNSKNIVYSLANNNSSCDSDCLLEMLWTLQMFSLHFCQDKFQKVLGVSPITLYVKSLQFCFMRFSNLKQNDQQLYISLQISIVETCISLCQDSREQFLLNQSNFVDIWGLVINFIFLSNQQQINQIFQKQSKPKQLTRQCSEQEWLQQNLRDQLQKLKNKIIQYMSVTIWLDTTTSQITFESVPKLFQKYLSLIEHTNPEDVERNTNFVLRVIFGLTHSIYFNFMSQQTIDRMVKCLQKYFLYKIKAHTNKIKTYGRYALNPATDYSDSEDSFDSQWQFEENQNRELIQFKEYNIYVQENYIEIVQEFIDAYQNNFPAMAKKHKSILAQLRKSIKDYEEETYIL